MTVEVDRFIRATRSRQEWSAIDFVQFCKEAVDLAKKFPVDRSEIAYVIVDIGSYFGDFSTQDTVPIRQEIKDLAADLELPDDLVYTDDGLSVDQKWQQLGNLVDRLYEQTVDS